jgi:hypothetical protein
MKHLYRRVADRIAILPVRPRRRDRPRIYALLSFRDEMRFLPGWFAANAHHVDGILAYDDGSADGSAEYVAAQPGVLELLHRDPAASGAWDQPAIHTALLEAAGRHHADWLMAIDADERLEEDFGDRARAEIVRISRRGARSTSVRIRELWDRPDTARVDGIWGGKRVVRLFAWRPDAVLDERRLHSHWAPVNSIRWNPVLQADLTVYHLRMIREEDRQARRLRLETADPDHEFQSIGYAYLTDTTGIQLEPLPPGRGYHPWHVDPDIAVVVIGVGNPPELAGAVESVLAQDVAAEVVVVNTGGGGARARFAPLGVRVVETPEVRYVGAARNLGIAATRAPVVAFLAGDCRAEPGWLAARLALHRAGHRAVASSLTNGCPHGVVSWASYALLSVNRMPTLMPDEALRYGVSYDRDLLQEVGPFREDLRTGEDAEYHRRLPPGTEIVWAPEVRTAHLHPTSMRALLAEQQARGQRARTEYRQLWGTEPRRLARRSLVYAVGPGAAKAIRRAEPGTRARIVAATPLMALGAVTYATGVLRGVSD